MPAASPTSTLPQEQQLIQSLVELMQEEQQLLVSANAEGLLAVTPQKSHLINQLAQLAKQRHQALAAAGFAPEEAGMDAWLSANDDMTARAGWDQLLSLTRDAKELNRVNGMLINKQLTHTNAIIQAMRTPAHADDAAVYRPSGQTSSGGPSRRYVVG
ncbi:MAG: flagellar protein FlgN [Massilia sp.]|nr:flagellar protein FlgN [Massilia sp.]